MGDSGSEAASTRHSAETAPGDNAVLTVRNLSKRFGPQIALQSLDLDIERGEVQALVGQNGSGKSTFVKILAGYHRPDPGYLARVEGSAVTLGSPDLARDAGIRFVHQDLGLVLDMTVAENFQLEGTATSLSAIRPKDERNTATEALSRLGYDDISPRALLRSLPEAQRAVVAIARALQDADAVRLLVLDEPTAALPGYDVQVLFQAVRRVRDNGTSVLFISHYLDEVMDLADRITVLRDGCRQATVATHEVSHARLVELMLGRLVDESLATPEDSRAADGAGGVLSMRQLAGSSLEPMDLDVTGGEVVGIAGLTGSGREEIAALITGQVPRQGDVTIAGESLPSNNPAAANRAGLSYVPVDRLASALFAEGTVRENLTITDLKPFWKQGLLSKRREREEVGRWISELDVRPPLSEAPILSLSGGNQQKVIIGRALRTKPRVLVLDEPTHGVDVGSKADIHELVRSAAADGAAVLVCSTDADELARLCTSVVVLRRGGRSTTLRSDEITVERIEQEQLAAVG